MYVENISSIAWIILENDVDENGNRRIQGSPIIVSNLVVH